MITESAARKIYLQWEEPSHPEDVTWCDERVNDTDVTYVRGDIVDKLRAELKNVCTQVDYLLAAIEADRIQDTNDVYTPQLSKIWIAAFYQELPIKRYSEA